MLQEKVNQMPPHQPQHRAFQMSSLKIFYLLFQIQSHVLQHHTVTSDPMTGGWGKRQANKQKQTTVIRAQKARSVRSTLFPRARTDPKCLLLVSVSYLIPKIRLRWADQLENLYIDSSINFHTHPSKFRAQHYANHSLCPLICVCPTSALPMQTLTPMLICALYHRHLCSKEDGLETAVF